MFYWELTKWFLTTGLIVFGTFWLFPWGNSAETISRQKGLQALSDSAYSFDAMGVLLGTATQTLFLFVIIGISVLKPWGRRSVSNKE